MNVLRLFSPVDHVWHQNAKLEAWASVARPPPKTSTFLLFWCIYFFQVELQMVSAFLRIIILHSFTWLLSHKYTFLCLLCQVCFPSLFVWSTTAVSWPSLSVLVQTHLMYTFLLCTFCTVVFPLSSWQLHWSHFPCVHHGFCATNTYRNNVQTFVLVWNLQLTY